MSSSLLGLTVEKARMRYLSDNVQLDELEMYLREPPIPLSDAKVLDDPLIYWKTNQMRFPSLTKMAFDFLCVQSSSVSSESVFSASGRVMDDFRSRLNSQTLEMLVELQSWLRSSRTYNWT